MPTTFSNPKNPSEKIQTNLSLREAQELIKSKGDRSDFASSLLRQFPSFSSSQRFHFYKIAEEIKNPTVKQVAGGLTAGTGFAKLYALFQTARKKLKYPKMTFQEDFGKVILSLAGEFSKNPNFIYIKTNDGDYQGKISPDGIFFPQSSCPQIVKDYIKNLSGDPAEFAKSYGLRTMRCCFCQIELTDPRSRMHGWGPICAEHYNLPWG